MKADAKTETAVMKVFEELGEAVGSRDTQRAVSLFAADADVVMLGSAEGEKAVGRRESEEFLDQLWSRPIAYSFEWRWHSVSAEGSVAWVFAEGSVHAKSADQDVSRPYRITLVLANRGDKWLIMHSHGSEPATAGEPQPGD